MSEDESTPTTVERLKAEGNVLHGQGSYQAAYQKYSEAIKEAPANVVLAILYANRAASCLAMKEYLDAFHDANTAAELDPTYAKAWARVGTAAHALEIWDVCRKAWTSALACLPTTDLTPTQLVLKAQFKAGVKAADAGEVKSTAVAKSKFMHFAEDSNARGNMPWDRALVLAGQNQLARGELPSSGFVILNAHRDFIRGIKTMQQIKIKRKADGNLEVKAIPNALVDITNGLLRDSRVFHADSRFFTQLESQLRFEAEFTGAWSSGGPKKVQKEVVARQRKEGWLPVRRALSVTVRAWMIRGFLDSQMGARTSGVEFYLRALDLLEWGRRTWPNVPAEDRGIIFEPSFVRGIRRLHLPAVMNLYLKQGAESGYTLENIAQMARDLIAETQASVRNPACLQDPGFFASFWIYPVAEGLSILGWYHMQLGLQHFDKTGDIDLGEEAVVNFHQSSRYYIQAAGKYPEDDEERPHMLAVALEALWWGAAPLRVTLPLCRKIRAAMPKPVPIWEFSSKSLNKRNANCAEAVRFLDDCERQLADGTATLESALMPLDLMERRVGRVAQLRDD
ncbi:hypothetical protein B0H17DRAFT_687044 [Mycena rosella]|uniref:Uncharacterized protein n=1 Tax=Mycena rosella TaxID=1033263 RepID=A0AAD7GGS9_MYCRO|nr:hypothetical protein B0H17DRAFT_687044 [Mycena rosella]